MCDARSNISRAATRCVIAETAALAKKHFAFAADDQAPVAQPPKLTPRGQDVDISVSCNDKISSAFKDLNEGVKVRAAQLLSASKRSSYFQRSSL